MPTDKGFVEQAVYDSFKKELADVIGVFTDETPNSSQIPTLLMETAQAAVSFISLDGLNREQRAMFVAAACAEIASDLLADHAVLGR